MSYGMSMAESLHEVLFEIRRIGMFVKVSAIDPITNTEVSIVGSSRTNQNALKAVAMRKLRYVITRNRKPGNDNRR